MVMVLIGLLVACSGTGSSPSQALVKKAIALQLNLTQEQLKSPLHLERSPQLDVKGIQITNSDRLRDQKLPTFHIQGTYNLNIQLSEQTIKQRQNPFEVYVQQQIEGETWRLLRPTAEGTGWLSYQIDGDLGP
ncbi:hypothetical protein [Roseofilum capinflatum]|uniref:Lipoprotein n=1 Tax=Roseofilum capinflatum BLCC-M114 TaxID=3022440 RepID=A0ABT7B9M2_9CYAN|nr:hypothetical protein [Roseofilum capinflatum]MDJ1175805.1 hypothetical protein [Roseofilum capinflatum BLCC-M114]